MDIRFIKAPSAKAKEILQMRSSLKWPEEGFDAIGLVQGKLIEMIVAADIAEKCVGVFVSDVRGSCPQNMVMIMIAGETSAVKEALNKIAQTEGSEYRC